MPGGGGVQDAQIQWYPGHMATAMRKLADRLKIVDVVIEVVDARLPRASANPALDELAARKQRIVVLSCEDLADPHATREWVAWYAARGRLAIPVNGKDQASVRRLRAPLGQTRTGEGVTRAIVVGIPNTGKSTIINGLVGRTAAKTEDKAGVTRSLQWFRVQSTLEVMDTPGILVPSPGRARTGRRSPSPTWPSSPARAASRGTAASSTCTTPPAPSSRTSARASSAA